MHEVGLATVQASVRVTEHWSVTCDHPQTNGAADLARSISNQYDLHTHLASVASL